LRGVWQYGYRELSTHSCEPSLKEKALGLLEAVKENVTTADKEAGFEDSSEEGVVRIVGVSFCAVNE
jgi:hypothetical protein